MNTKHCSMCKIEKNIANFSKDREKKDGLQYKCKECNSEVKKNYSKSEVGKEAKRRYSQKYNNKYPEKRVAVSAVGHAIRDGRLERRSCEICGTGNNVHGHHDDYSQPLDVRWLCRKHHMEHHFIN